MSEQVKYVQLDDVLNILKSNSKLVLIQPFSMGMDQYTARVIMPAEGVIHAVSNLPTTTIFDRSNYGGLHETEKFRFNLSDFRK